MGLLSGLISGFKDLFDGDDNKKKVTTQVNPGGGGFRGTNVVQTTQKVNKVPEAVKNMSKTPTTTTNTNSNVSGGSVGVSANISAPNANTANPYQLDLSDILAAYTKSADAQKKTITDSTAARKQSLADALSTNLKTLETSEATQRENLLTSLRRFQEDTAKARSQQQASFNSSRADLEAQAFMANRAATQSAAARGLGGSGLQQLAQLQNIINQSGEVNKLATANTETLNALSQELARQEEDTTTNLNTLAKEMQNKRESLTTEQKNTLNELMVEEANRLQEIEANATNLKEQLKYQEAVRAENARIQAEQFAAEMQARNASIAAQYDLYNRQAQDEKAALLELGLSDIGITTQSGIKAIEKAYNNAKSANKSDKKVRQAVADAYNQQLENLYNYAIGTGITTSQLSSYEKQLLDSYNTYYNKTSSKPKASSTIQGALISSDINRLNGGKVSL